MASLCSQCGAPTAPQVFTTEAENLPRHSILMNTNKPPESHEFVYVHGLVSKTDKRLTSLNDEISRLQERIDLLSNERASLHEYRRKNARILSCLRRMPPEVFGVIFSWTLPSSDDLSCWSFRSQVRSSPWTLTWVCRRWREIAISTPSLWSLVHVSGPISRYHSRSSMIQTQVQRARALQIHFDGHEAVGPTPQAKLFELLSKHSDRWEELSLDLNWILLSHMDAFTGKLAALQRLRLGWRHPDPLLLGITSLDCFETASSLADIALSSDFRHGLSLPAQNQITRYDFDIHLDNQRDLLESMPHLVEARVRACSGIHIQFHDSALFPQLKRLYIDLPDTLDYFEAPALEELAIRAHEDNGNHTYRCISAFVKRSSCTIRKLCFKGQIRPEEALHIVLESPSITELIFLDGKDFDRYFTMLLSEDTTVAPQLSAIHFGFCVKEMDYELYLEMLESRRNAPECALRGAMLLSPSYSLKIAALSSKFDALRRDRFQFSLVSGAAAREQRESWLYGGL